MSTQRLLFSSAMILLFCLLAYSTAFTAPFIWDDEVMVLSNPLIRSWSSLTGIFTSTAFGASYEPGTFYRPLQILSYVFTYKLFGLSPVGFRTVNILLHFLSGLAVFHVFRRLRFSDLISLLAALLFVVHPIGIESVTYISGRGDALMMCFAMWSMVCFLRFSDTDSKAALLLAVILGCLSILSKENLVALPVLYLVYLFLFRRNSQRWAWSAVFGFLCLALGYSAFRLWGGHANFTALSWIVEASLIERIQTLPWAIWTYFRLMVLPVNLHMEYHTVITSWLPYSLLWPVLVGLIYAGWRCFGDDRKLWLFSWAWMGVGVLPVLNIMPVLAASLREHWFYFSAVGFVLILFIVLRYICQIYSVSDRRVLIGVMIFVLILTGITMRRNLDWQDPFRLYSHDLHLEPRSFLLHNNLGVIYFRRGDMDFAKEHFIRAIESSPGEVYAVAYNNLGSIMQREGTIDVALDLYLKSIDLGRYELGYANAASIYRARGDLDRARALINDGLLRYPNSSVLQSF